MILFFSGVPLYLMDCKDFYELIFYYHQSLLACLNNYHSGYKTNQYQKAFHSYLHLFSILMLLNNLLYHTSFKPSSKEFINFSRLFFPVFIILIVSSKFFIIFSISWFSFNVSTFDFSSTRFISILDIF